MKNTSDGLIGRLRTKAAISKPEDTSVERSTAEKAEKEEGKTGTECLRVVGQLQQAPCAWPGNQVEKEERGEWKKYLKQDIG